MILRRLTPRLVDFEQLQFFVLFSYQITVKDERKFEVAQNRTILVSIDAESRGDSNGSA
ncbi:MAG: hypothetical protein GY820_18910 [Gammaproteobacteria bacterium]|nr:hypothetical protein [Gammaproteobacteria bacterium]